MMPPANVTAVARAPLRISLAGGGTDLPSYADEFGGQVLSVAINRFVSVCVQTSNFFGDVRAAFEQSETVPNSQDLSNPFARAALLSLGVTRDVELASLADVPGGTGLGSSGAFTVAVIEALHCAKHGREPARDWLAERAASVEIDDLNRPVGKQDHYMAVLGGVQRMDFGVNGQVSADPVICDDIEQFVESRLHAFYTGRSRDAGRVLTEQAARTSANDSRTVEALHAIRGLVPDMEEALVLGDWDEVGRILATHWENKKQLSGRVTTQSVDDAYSLALRSGAIGGKLMGAGGGGFLLLVSEKGKAERLRAALSCHGLTELEFGLSWRGSQAHTFGGGEGP